MNAATGLFVELAVRSTLLIALAWLAAAALRGAGASAAMRHFAWASAMLGLLLLPLMMVALPDLPFAVLPAVPESAPAPETVALVGIAPILQEAAPAASPALWLVAAYVAVAAILLARFLAARRTLARLWREADPADEGWSAALAGAAADLGLRRAVALRLARGFVMPMTWGTRAPKILLPADARAWPEPQRRLVLLHELAHVRRRDSLALSAGGLACALYWLHPGAWFAARRLRLEQEIAADDLALRAGVPACHYAESLLDLAAAFHLPRTRIRGLPASAMALTSQLERRLAAIIGPESRRAPGPAFAALAGSFALTATWLAAAATPVTAAVEMAGPASATFVRPVPVVPPAALPAVAPEPASAQPEVAPVLAVAASAAPVGAEPNDGAPDFVRFEHENIALQQQADRLEHENLALQDQAVRLSLQVAAQEDAAVARGDTRLARHLNAQRRAYERQAATYAYRNRVVHQQRRVLSRRAEILARQPDLMERRAEAERRGEPVPPLEPLPAVPAMPAVPPIPPVPPTAQPPPTCRRWRRRRNAPLRPPRT